MKRVIRLRAAEKRTLMSEGRATIRRPILPPPERPLRPLCCAATGEIWWGHDLEAPRQDAGVIEFSDGSTRSISPPRVKAWPAPTVRGARVVGVEEDGGEWVVALRRIDA